MPKYAAKKPLIGKSNDLYKLKQDIIKYKQEKPVTNNNPFDPPTEKNSVSYLWRRLLSKPSKNSVKGGCPHNLYAILKEFYKISDNIICSNNKNCIHYNSGENNDINTGEIVRELNFEDLKIDWGNKKSSKSKLLIKYNDEEPIYISLHRRGGTTFEKDLRPGTYDKIENKLTQHTPTSKRKSERLFMVFRNHQVVLPINNNVSLGFELETSCDDLVDRKFPNVVGSIGLCMGHNDTIQNIIVFRTNLKDDDSYLSSKIRIITKVQPNYEDKLRIGTLEIFLHPRHISNCTTNNNNINMVDDDSRHVSHNQSSINDESSFQSQENDNLNQQLQQLNSDLQIQHNNQHEYHSQNTNDVLLHQNRMLIPFVEFVMANFPHVIYKYDSENPGKLPILMYTLYPVADPLNTTHSDSPSLPAIIPFSAPKSN